MSHQQLIFVNHSQETFTETASGAIATYIWELCQVAELDGCRPIVVTRSAPQAPFPWQPTVFLQVPEVPRGGLGWWAARARRKAGGWRHLGEDLFARNLGRALRPIVSQSTTLLFQNNPELALYVKRAFTSCRVVHLFQNPLEINPELKAAFAREMDLLVAVSRYTASAVERNLALGAGAVHTVLSGVNTEHFFPGPEPVGTPVIGFVGRTGREKAPDMLLRAAVRLLERTREFRLQIVGSNHWDRFELDAYQRELGDLVEVLEANGVSVWRPGHVGRERLPNVLRRAHIHVMPSRWDEPFGLATLEGMATGLATVASRTGGTPEVTAGAAVLFERDDDVGLAAELGRLLEDASLRRKYASRARDRALELTWARTWSNWRHLLSL